MSEGAPKDVGEKAELLLSQNSRQKTTWFRALLRRTDFTVGLATSFLYLFFCFSTDTFFTAYNQFNLLRTAGCYVFVALSQGMLQIMGGTNLAIGAAGALSGMFACQAMQFMGWPIWAAALLAFVVGMGTGYITGWIVTTFKLPAFVVTLALQYILNGVVMGRTKGYPFTELPPSIVGLGRAGIGGVMPLVTILAILTLAVLYYVFRYTVMGRQILASGGNAEAARLSGIPTKRIYLIASVLSGLFSAISAMIWISRAGSMQASLGSDWMMVSFSVSMLGASKAGFISPIGFFFSAVLITLIKNGLVMIHVDPYYENVFLGFIVLFAISIDGIRTVIAARSKKL